MSGVNFSLTEGGLAIAQANEDHFSLIATDIAAPSTYGSAKIKEYHLLDQVESDGIIETDVTYGLLWYQAREFFRIAPNATLYISFSGSTIEEILTATNGKLRQIGTWGTLTDALSAINSQLADFESRNIGVVFIYGQMDPAIADIASLPDATAFATKGLGILISGDGSGRGAALATSLGVDYIPAVGAVLGALAAGKVNENIGWRGKFNLEEVGGELSLITHFAGDTLAPNEYESIANKGYITLLKEPGYTGTYVDTTHTATLSTSDYSTLENCRTIYKAIRNVKAKLLPYVNSPVYFTGTGSIQPSSIKAFEGAGMEGLESMKAAGELSNYKVYINPDQNTLSTRELYVQIRIQPVGVAQTINVSIGLAVTV